MIGCLKNQYVSWSMKSRILTTYPDAFPSDSTGEVVDRKPDLEMPNISQAVDKLQHVSRVPLGKHNLVKRRPKLKSRYKERVEKAIEYARTIEDWDDLVDPRTLVFYCLGPEPSAFVLRNPRIEGKKKMTTKFNKGMYDKMRAKKDEPLSHLGKKVVRITGKGPLVISAASVTYLASGTDTTRSASLAASIEEIPTPASKKQRTSDKGKEKVDSRSPLIWDDKKLAVDRAREVVTAEDLRVFSGSSTKDLVDRHLHKLVQVLGESIHLSSDYLAQEAKVESALSQISVLEMDNSKLKKELITATGEANTAKEEARKLQDDLRTERQLVLEKGEQLASARERLKGVAARAIEGF